MLIWQIIYTAFQNSEPALHPCKITYWLILSAYVLLRIYPSVMTWEYESTGGGGYFFFFAIKAIGAIQMIYFTLGEM